VGSEANSKARAVRRLIVSARGRRAVETVDEILARYARRHTGVAIATLAPGGCRVLTRGGVARDSIFEIGSITKVFTALLLARMVQDGRASLNERPFRERRITLVDLATHTAGLPRLPKGMLMSALREPRDPYAAITPEVLDAAVSSVRLRRQGRVRYSNFGAGLLGHVLAQRAGRSYADAVAAEICGPLGLHDTFVAVPETKRSRFVVGHDRRGRRVPHWTHGALAGAGALRSTPTDLLLFLAFQLNPPDSPLGAAARLTHEPRAARGQVHVGLGWLRLPLGDDGANVLWHNGGTGGFRSFVGFAPERGTAVAVLSNCTRSVDAIGMRALHVLR